MKASSPFAVLAFLWIRSARNAAMTTLSRLKEPRYLVGGLAALAWFSTVFFRGGAPRTMRGGAPRIGDVLPLMEPAGALAIGVLVCFWWLFTPGRASLALSEAEVQFLFPAPLPRKAILHFSVLKTQAGILFSSLILAIVMQRSVLPNPLRSLPAIFIVMATLQLHYKGLTLRRAAWGEAGRAPRTIYAVGSRVAALALLGGLVALAASVVQALVTALQAGSASSAAGVVTIVEGALAASPLGFLLVPFRALDAPLFAPGGAAFLRTLPVAILILVLHHFWAVGAEVRYEDATLENAARRAAQRQRRRGRVAPIPAERKRGVVPFALVSPGRPEVSIFWKNLLGAGRTRLTTSLSLYAGSIVLAGAAGFGVARWNASMAMPARGIVPFIAAMGFFVGVLVLPTNLRLDFRKDLLNAAEMKLWPLSSARLAAAELAAPLFVSVTKVWLALAIALALSSGIALAHPVASDANAPPLFTSPLLQLPLAIGIAIVGPAVAAIVLVVQNALTLAFPMWFPPGEAQRRGFAASGSNLISFFGTILMFGVAAIPSALLAGGAIAAGAPLLGFWIAPIAGFLAAIPLAAEAIGGVFLLGKLFEKFDPSLDLGT